MPRLACVLSLLFLVATVALAGVTGKITGKVVDKSNGEPLIGANIVVLGTKYGAITDLNGDFVILNIPAGTYDLRSSYLGYRNVTMTEVVVSPDLTTTVSFELPSEAIEVNEVTVVAERKLIQRDATGTQTSIDAQAIKVLPVTSYQQVMALTPGFVNSANGSGDDGFHLRGGRSGELSYMVDGVRVDDPISGGAALDVSRIGISSLSVLSGSFNAEYGQAQSGIINITTPEGTSRYSANVRMATDNFGISDNNWDSYRGEVSASGPIPLPGIARDAMTLFLSGDRVLTRTHLNKFTGPVYTSPGGREVGGREFDHGLWDRRTRGNGKLSVRPLEQVKLQVGSSLSHRSNKNYSHGYKEFPEWNAQNRSESQLHTMNFTHTLSQNTFYEVKYSYFKKEYKRFLFEEDLDGSIHDNRFRRIFRPVASAFAFDSTSNYEFNGPYASLLTLDDIAEFGFTTLGAALVDTAGNILAPRGAQLTPQLMDILRAQGITTATVMVPSMSNYFEDNYAIAETYAASFTSQVDKNNLVKLGFEYKEYTVSNYWVSGINASWDHIDVLMPYAQRHGEFTEYTFHPIQASAYIQDKIEFDDIILNVGLRFDYLDTGGPDVYNIIDNPADSSLRNKTVGTKYHFSPRIGFAHPVTEKIKFRFTYGQFYQYPDFNFIYRRFNMGDPNYPLPNLAQGYEPSFGNPNLKPEVTQAYEFGSEFELSENLVGVMTIFYKDTYDYISTARIDRDPYAYTQIVNLDYANSRGLEVSLRKRMSDHFSYQVHYTYSRAEGNADYWATHANEAYLASVYGIVAPKRTQTLSWDQPHTVNFTVSVDYEDWGLSFIGQYGSGLPYTPTDNRGIPVGDVNSSRQPWTGTVDMRAFKTFDVGITKVILFADMTNVLNRKNVLNVFTSTGKPDYSDNPNVSAENMHRPQWFGPPRHVELGLELEL